MAFAGWEQREAAWPASGPAEERHAQLSPADGILCKALTQFIGPLEGSPLFTRSPRLEASPSPAPAVVSWAPSSRLAYDLAHLGYSRFYLFALLPSPSAPRWLLPLGDPRLTRAGWQLYTPYRLRARMLKALAERVAQTGWTGWARHQVLVASRQPLPLETLVSQFTGERQPLFALSLWPPRRYHKLTLQVMRPNGEILGYIRLPLTEAASERLRHEASMLEQLWDFPPLRPHIPRVFYSGPWGDGYLLFRAPGRGRPGPAEFTPLHQRFLQTLGSVRPVEKPGPKVVEEVAARWEKAVSRLGTPWERLGEVVLRRASRALEGVMIPCGLSHGDFVPWNTRVEDGQLFVFDWEMSTREAPCSWDVFNFHLRVRSMLNKNHGGSLYQGPSDRACFWLYLLSTVCESLDEQTPRDSSEIAFRQQVLLQELA